MSVYGPLFVGTTRVVYKRAVITHIRPPLLPQTKILPEIQPHWNHKILTCVQ